MSRRRSRARPALRAKELVELGDGGGLDGLEDVDLGALAGDLDLGALPEGVELVDLGDLGEGVEFVDLHTGQGIEIAGPPTVLSEAGQEVQLLMLRRSRGGEDLLHARCRAESEADGEDWAPVSLRGDGPLRWASEDGAVVVMLDKPEVWAELLPGIAQHPKLEACAPEWPSSVVKALRPWSLKGPGTVVFDAATFLEEVATLSRDGPVLFPGGAERLGLPTAAATEALKERMADGKSLWSFLRTGPVGKRGQGELPLPYGEMLRLSPELRTGIVDLRRARYGSDQPRTAKLTSQRPFGWEYAARTWAHGAAIRAVEPYGSAEVAGCQGGDAIVSINGEWVFDSPLSRVDELLQTADPPLDLELEQPVLAEPLYVREASMEMLQKLRGQEEEEMMWDPMDSLTMQLLHMSEGRLPFDEEPMVFAGDGGSASHVHRDSVPQVQMCHNLHGTKLFGVARPDAPPLPKPPKHAQEAMQETAFPVDTPPSPQQAAWLGRDNVSVVVCRPGDVLCFWGGNMHFGSNGMASGPNVSLFHGCGLPGAPTALDQQEEDPLGLAGMTFTGDMV